MSEPGVTDRDRAKNWAFKAKNSSARAGAETAESCALIALVYAVLAVEDALTSRNIGVDAGVTPHV